MAHPAQRRTIRPPLHHITRAAEAITRQVGVAPIAVVAEARTAEVAADIGNVFQ